MVDSVSVASSASVVSMNFSAARSPSRVMSHSDSHTTARASASSKRCRFARANESESASKRSFVYVRSSSFTRMNAGRFLPAAAATTVDSPSTSSSKRSVRKILPVAGSSS